MRRDDHSFGDYLSTFPSHRETDMILSSDRLYVGTISTLDRSDRQFISFRLRLTESEIRIIFLGLRPTDSMKSRSARARESRQDRPIANSVGFSRVPQMEQRWSRMHLFHLQPFPSILKFLQVSFVIGNT